MIDLDKSKGQLFCPDWGSNSSLQISDGSGSKIFDPDLGSGQPFMVGFEFGKFPLKMSNFSTFALPVKKNIFGSGQRYAWVGLGQGPSLLQMLSQFIFIGHKHLIYFTKVYC